MTYRNCFICIICTSVIAAAISLFSSASYAAELNSSKLGSLPQNINAEHIYEDKSAILNGSMKNLVILMPNEAHESLNQPKSQLPLTNQPYLPQNAVVRTGTTLVWFNDDVGHNHKETIVNEENGKIIYQSHKVEYNTAAGPIILNKSGSYTYYEENVNENDPSFTMKGTISVLNKLSDRKLSDQDSGHNANNRTIGMFMVPELQLPKYVSEFGGNGFTLDTRTPMKT